MSTPLLPFSLLGLTVEHVSTTAPTLLIDARTSTPTASCPDYHAPSARVHSRYTRHLRDLPVLEQPVRLRVHVRRFRCLTPTCAGQTFAERLPRLAPSHAQRTVRLTETIRIWVRTETLPLDQRGYRGAGKIDPYIPCLQTRLAEGCTNQSRLWREIQQQGFTSTRSLVAKWIHAHGQHTPMAPPPAAQLPAARQLAWLLFQDAEKRSAEDQALVEQLQQHTELTHVQKLLR